MGLLVVHTTHKLVKEVVAMHARLSTFVRYFLKVKKMVGGSVFASACKKNITEERRTILAL